MIVGRNTLLIMTVLSLVLIGCAGGLVTYTSRAALNDQLKVRVEGIEQRYLARATEEAAFAANCSREQMTASIVSKQKETIVLVVNESLLRDDVIKTIGVEGCDTRISFKLYCGEGQLYAAGEFEHPNYTECELISSIAAKTE